MTAKKLSIGMVVVLAVLLPSWLVTAAQGGSILRSAGATAAPLQGPEIWISSPPVPSGHDRYRPAVGYNYVHGEQLVAWQNEWPDGHKDIYARRVAETGELLSWFAITAPTPGLPGSRQQPAVAYNASNAEYLVVWVRDIDGDGWGDDVWGRIVAWNGSYQHAEFEIYPTWPNRAFVAPEVVWNHNRNQFMVIWNAWDTSGVSPVPNDISGRLVYHDGSLGSLRVMTTSAFPHQADIAYNWSTDDYLLAFVRVYTEVTTGNDIYGVLLNWDGTHKNPPVVLTIADSSKHENAPAVVATASGHYLVAWEHEYSPSDHDIVAEELDGDGSPAGWEYQATMTDDDRWPDVAASFTEDAYLFVWERAAPGGQAVIGWYVGHTVNTGDFEVASAAFWDHQRPGVGGGRGGYLMAYEGNSSDLTEECHIYGRIYRVHEVFLPLVLRASP